PGKAVKPDRSWTSRSPTACWACSRALSPSTLQQGRFGNEPGRSCPASLRQSLSNEGREVRPDRGEWRWPVSQASEDDGPSGVGERRTLRNTLRARRAAGRAG